MNKKLLVVSLMISAMGFSSLFAEEEEKEVKIQQELSCDKCGNVKEEEIVEESGLPKPTLSCEDKTQQVKEDDLLGCDCDKRRPVKDDEAV